LTGRRAFSLPELLIGMGLLSLFLLVGYSMLQMADKVFHQVSGNEDATMQVKRAARMLEKDLVATNVANVTVVNVTSGLPASAPDGSAVCMLSANDRGLGDMMTNVDGEPLWQRNILYYVIVPQGDPCQGGADAQGFDDRCPHKLLIRKIINLPQAVVTDNEINADPTAYLTRPAGRVDISNLLGEANVEQVELVARGLVTMQVRVQPDPNYPHEVTVMLSALNQPKGRKLSIGNVPLTGQGALLVTALSIFPRNNR
jgi:prepilin-type N-terminal cleavage/methylation domain-containing protein